MTCDQACQERQLVVYNTNHVLPRPPDTPAITQAQLDARREAAESKIKPVPATQDYSSLIKHFTPTNAPDTQTAPVGNGGAGGGGPKLPTAPDGACDPGDDEACRTARFVVDSDGTVTDRGTEGAAAEPARFVVDSDGTVTVRGTEDFYRGADLQEALENLNTASQNIGTTSNALVDIARGPIASGTLQPSGPTLGPYAPPLPAGMPDLSATIPALMMSGSAIWMAVQYWWNVWFG